MRTLLLLLVLTSPCYGYTTMTMYGYDDWLNGHTGFVSEYYGVLDQQPGAVINTLVLDRTYSGFDFVDFHFDTPIWAFYFEQTSIGATNLIMTESWGPFYDHPQFGVTTFWPTSNVRLIHEANNPSLTAHLTSISWVYVVPEPSALLLLMIGAAFLMIRR